MPASTTPLGLPYPIASDAPAGHTQMQSLAGAVQTAIGSVAAGLQEGVIDAGSFEVTQASGGASVVLDIASNVGSGCYVDDDGLSPARVARYYVPPTASKSTVTVATAHATLPRVDAVVVSMAGVVSIVSGTATAGATLDNARDGSHGGAAIPSDALHLADALVPATDTTISNSQIRDRRKWARGANVRIVRNADAGAGDDYTVNSSVLALLDGTNLNPRIECSGVPVRVTLIAALNPGLGTDTGGFSPQVDSAGVDGMPSVGGTASGVAGIMFNLPASTIVPVCLQWTFVPAAGSHLIGPSLFAISGTYDALASVDTPLLWTVEEILRQNTANNATTSG